MIYNKKELLLSTDSYPDNQRFVKGAPLGEDYGITRSIPVTIQIADRGQRRKRNQGGYQEIEEQKVSVSRYMPPCLSTMSTRRKASEIYATSQSSGYRSPQLSSRHGDGDWVYGLRNFSPPRFFEVQFGGVYNGFCQDEY